MLDDKVVVVTGAARGIGQQTAVDLAKQGAKLVLGDMISCDDTAALLDDMGAEHVQAIVDVTNFAQCEALMAQGVEKFGSIDGVVHLAAVYANLKIGPFEDVPEDEFDLCMNVNVKGTWNICRAVSPIMKKARKGSIVNVASNTAIAGWPMLAQYVASKGAVISMSRTMARELGGFDIRVNSVAPGSVTTDSTKQLAGDDYDELSGQVAEIQSIHRHADASDITGIFAYLMSDASLLLTGQTIAIDGGMTTS